MTRRRAAILAGVAIAIGGATLLYRGPGRAFVRGHVGDVAAAMLVYAALAAVWRAPAWVRALVTFAIAAAIELGQLAWRDTTRGVTALVLGSAFDPWDLAAYAAGAMVGVAWDRASPRPNPGVTRPEGGRPDSGNARARARSIRR